MSRLQNRPEQGAGLTRFVGPGKLISSNAPRLRKIPFKGGGVGAGGTLHAGHNYWFSSITPYYPSITHIKHKSTNVRNIINEPPPVTAIYKRGPPSRRTNFNIPVTIQSQNLHDTEQKAPHNYTNLYPPTGHPHEDYVTPSNGLIETVLPKAPAEQRAAQDTQTSSTNTVENITQSIVIEPSRGKDDNITKIAPLHKSTEIDNEMVITNNNPIVNTTFSIDQQTRMADHLEHLHQKSVYNNHQIENLQGQVQTKSFAVDKLEQETSNLRTKLKMLEDKIAYNQDMQLATLSSSNYQRDAELRNIQLELELKERQMQELILYTQQNNHQQQLSFSEQLRLSDQRNHQQIIPSNSSEIQIIPYEVPDEYEIDTSYDYPQIESGPSSQRNSITGAPPINIPQIAFNNYSSNPHNLAPVSAQVLTLGVDKKVKLYVPKEIQSEAQSLSNSFSSDKRASEIRAGRVNPEAYVAAATALVKKTYKKKNNKK